MPPIDLDSWEEDLPVPMAPFRCPLVQLTMMASHIDIVTHFPLLAYCFVVLHLEMIFTLFLFSNLMEVAGKIHHSVLKNAMSKSSLRLKLTIFFFFCQRNKFPNASW